MFSILLNHAIKNISRSTKKLLSTSTYQRIMNDLETINNPKVTEFMIKLLGEDIKIHYSVFEHEI